MSDPFRLTAATAEADDVDGLLSSLNSMEESKVALGPADLARLVSCLSHRAKSVRRSAAGALTAALLRGDAPRSACEDLLSSDDAHARWGAAFALARAGLAGDRVLAIALAALDSGDGDLRWAAESVLAPVAKESGELRDRLRALAVQGTTRTRKMALLCLFDSGERDGVLYRSALADVDPYVRLAGLTCLARGGDRSAESLSAIAAVAEGDDDARVRRGAAAVFRRLTAHLEGEAE